MKKDKENHTGKLQITRKDPSRESGERGGRNQCLLRMWAIGTHVVTATRRTRSSKTKGKFPIRWRRSLFSFELTTGGLFVWHVSSNVLDKLFICVGVTHIKNRKGQSKGAMQVIQNPKGIKNRLLKDLNEENLSLPALGSLGHSGVRDRKGI